MKKIITAAMLLGACALKAQTTQRQLVAGEVIEPYHVEVTFDETVHILFPAEVRYVDLGSTNLIAGKADGAENVVRIKAAVRGFEGETNFTVITADGVLYTFNATYAQIPGSLSVVIGNRIGKEQCGEDVSSQAYIRLEELGEHSPLRVNRLMQSIYDNDSRHIKTIGSKRYGVQLLLRGIYVDGDLFYFHTALTNFSKVNFDIDRIRFRIADRRVAKRTALQESFTEPVRSLGDQGVVEAGKTVRNVYVFRKFTIPDDKIFVMDVFERNGGRHQSFTISERELNGIRTVIE